MGSLFAENNAVFEESIDLVHAEEFSFAPMKDVVDCPPVADTDRDAVSSLQAVFIMPGFRIEQGASENVRVGSDSVKIEVLKTEVGGQQIKRFDRFTRALDGVVWEVRSFDRDYGERVICNVAEVA